MFAVVERFPNRFNDGVIPTRSVGRTMARQVKSVSIPERLQERVQDIPNFTQWVIAALDNPQASEAVSSAATNRRVHLLHLEHLLADLEDIRTDLFTMLRQKKRAMLMPATWTNSLKPWTTSSTTGRLRQSACAASPEHLRPVVARPGLSILRTPVRLRAEGPIFPESGVVDLRQGKCSVTVFSSLRTADVQKSPDSGHSAVLAFWAVSFRIAVTASTSDTDRRVIFSM